MAIEITGSVGHIEYLPTLCSELPEYTLEQVEAGDPDNDGAFMVELNEGHTVAVSRWVSPKRTRSYPFARVYDTLQTPRRVALVPLVKDEGDDGDRDYLQWDTVSLLSLLNVYVIPVYYIDAEEHPSGKEKIKAQKLDYEYVSQRLNELRRYQNDALHWNLREMENVEEVADKIQHYYYEVIGPKFDVKMSDRGRFKSKIAGMVEDVEEFKKTSRKISSKAQSSEATTKQLNETVLNEKGEVTLTNFLGGEYHFTVDEVVQVDGFTVVIEKKGTKDGVLPSLNDVKDGLLKLILYMNIYEATVDGKESPLVACLGMTGGRFPGTATSNQNPSRVGLSEMYESRLANIFTEATENSLLVFASHSDLPEKMQLALVSTALDGN